jgi:sulfite exporter TauE/SafE
MLNEASVKDRTSAQGMISLSTSVGQLTSSALVGAVAASMGGGVKGYGTAYMVIGVVAGLMILLTLGLKSRQQEFDTVAQNAQIASASD